MIVGGKLTTFRVMAREVVTGLGLELEEASDPGPYPAKLLPASVEEAVREEMCLTVTDYLRRRTLQFCTGADQGLGQVDAVASEMGKLLGWDEDYRRVSVDAYRREVAQSRAFRA